jgi:hypothetical protein
MTPRRTRVTLAALLLVGTLVVGGAFALAQRPPEDTSSAGARDVGTQTGSRPQSPATGRRLTRQEQSTVEAAVTRLRAMEPVTARTSAQYPPIEKAARRQPDLYAAAFAKRLLTQDYRTPRRALLAWVQSEAVSSNEPSVVGLTPPALRGRLAVASLTDTSDGPAPIPTAQTWSALAHRRGHTKVKIRRVIIPPTWTAAVAAGKVSDPGVTAREVDAEVTLHTRAPEGAHTQTYSVALTMNLEGPPTRDDYGFVTAVTYRAVEGGN